MRILYILDNIINKAGVERIMTEKMNYLSESGYDISLVTTAQNDLPLSFTLSKKIKYHPVNTPIPSKTDYPFISWLLLFCKARSKYKAAINKAIQDIHPDIVICTTYLFDILDMLINTCHKVQIKIIIESHIQRKNVFMEPRLAYNHYLSFFGRLHDQYILSYMKKAEKLVCLTNEDMQSWEELGFNNLCVIPNMITIYPPKETNYSSKRVIAVGRYSHQKGFDMLIKAWGHLSKKYPDWHLYIFGNEDRTPYEEMVKREKCQDSCHLMPVTEDISAEYGKSSIFVMSSRYEGMPLALIEAMSSGLACVSFNCPNGPSEIIDNGNDGFLAKNGDVNDLITKIENLICDETLRQKIGIKARQNIARYSPESIMQKIILYRRIHNDTKTYD